jgi:RimJ/RimL family protein N-acetyltransferase
MKTDLSLRLLQERDIDKEYVSWFSNSDGHLDFYTGSGRVFNKNTILEDFHQGEESKRWFYYIIESNGEKIGNIKIGPIDLRNKTSDLVCFIGNRNYLGKGLATKAIALANEIAFNRYDIRRLHGGMYATNIPSIKAYTRAGWLIEATMEGFYLVDDKAVDRICVACFNPKYFNK